MNSVSSMRCRPGFESTDDAMEIYGNLVEIWDNNLFLRFLRFCTSQ
jgi:hypothetical protein